MGLTFPHKCNASLLSWGRTAAHRAGLQLVDTVYDEDTFTLKFVVPLYEDATEAQLYRMRANAFYSEFLCAPWTVGKVERKVNDTTKLVTYSMSLIPTTEKD